MHLSNETSPNLEPPELIGKPQLSCSDQDFVAKLGWLVATSSRTYGISSGNTSARMLMESVLALEVGAAARRIFNKAICRRG